MKELTPEQRVRLRRSLGRIAGQSPQGADLEDLLRPDVTGSGAHDGLERRSSAIVVGGISFLIVIGFVLVISFGRPVALESDHGAASGQIEGGVGWSRIQHNESIFGGQGDQVALGVAIAPTGQVVVGIDEGEAGINEDNQAAVWFSEDGTWTRVASDDFSDAAMMDVAWFDARRIFVAVGQAVSEGAVWLSPNGTDWELTTKLQFENPPGGIEVHAVAVIGPQVVAVGREWLGEGVSVPAAWASTDGRSWERGRFNDGKALEPTTNESLIVDVASLDSRLIAVGYSYVGGASLPLMWTSTDGTAWESSELEFGRGSSVAAVSARGDSLVVVLNDVERSMPHIWYSVDAGVTWMLAEQPSTGDRLTLYDVVQSDLGYYIASGELRGGANSSSAVMWTSESGSSWMALNQDMQIFSPSEGSDGTAVLGLGSGQDGLVAVGIEGKSCADRYSRCDLDAAVWAFSE